jgi:tRNA uracil 4-sulfurtransferase
MEKIIFIKYGELSTKKGNINLFINKLHQNVLRKLKDESVNIKYNVARMYIELNNSNEAEVIKKLQTVFGIHSIVIAYKIDSSLASIEEHSLELLNNNSFKTFKVETKRSDKRFPYTSMDVSKMIGSYLLKNIDNITVDVHHPEVLLNIEIRPYYTYLYINEIKGLGGYPAGIQGKGILMLSGGIDSPVAGYLALKRGIDLECLYFESPPHTSIEAQKKVIKLSEKLSNYGPNIKLHIVPFTKIQETIYKDVDSTYLITIMRRMMYRIGERLVNKRHAHVLINGESIGQVASQTLSSIRVINSVTNIPIIRPVACMDKLEIIDIAKKIGTYDISILPYEDCCTIFVPEHPVINPNMEKCLNFENSFDYELLIDEAISNVKTIYIDDIKNNQFNNLL